MWEYQMHYLTENGYRCIAYDRRGFGRSSRPSGPYNYNALTDDLRAVLEALNLWNVTLVGFSMGGGEVARYFKNYGGEGVSQAVLISSVTPFMLKTEDNPEGTEEKEFERMAKEMKDDRVGFLKNFGKTFFGVGMLSHPISDALMDYYLKVQAEDSARATLQCADAFATTDFRPDMGTIHVPTLIIHGDKDETVPIDAAGKQAHQMVNNSQLKVYEGEPHGLFYTAKDKLNEDLLEFLQQRS
jgi:pimeloyl-ACP methyl ester carboxylesterase